MMNVFHPLNNNRKCRALNYPGFFEDRVRAALVNSLDGFGREDKSDSFLKLRYINALFLEVGILADRASRIELGSTSPVGVTSTHLGTLFQYWTNFGHIGANLYMI